MIIKKGDWSGRGSFIPEGASLGVTVNVELDVQAEAEGWIFRGALSGGAEGDILIRIAGNEVGTYAVDVRIADVFMEGVAKLESEPNLALLWDVSASQTATAALFNVDRGIGCRGVFQSGGETLTWEILFRPLQQVVQAHNVVSLNRRR